jgi:hypothetical protein
MPRARPERAGGVVDRLELGELLAQLEHAVGLSRSSATRWTSSDSPSALRARCPSALTSPTARKDGRCAYDRPMGRRAFTRSEADQIRRLLREKAVADRSRQKVLRSQLRRHDFYGERDILQLLRPGEVESRRRSCGGQAARS